MLCLRLQQIIIENVSHKMNFFLQDGLVFLRENKKKYDLIVVDVASDDGIDDRFLSDDYFKLIKKSLSKNGIFVSNLCSSADLEHPENTFFQSLRETYTKNFKSICIFKGNESDRIYYKSFFDIEQRVIDITNLIFIVSNQKISLNKNYKPIEELKINIQAYINDLQQIL